MWRAATTELVYVRLHGHTRKYASSYDTKHLQRWAKEALVWARERRTVLVYFDNDADGAVGHARALRKAIDAAAGEMPIASMSLPATRRAAGGRRAASVPILDHWRRAR